MCEYDSSKSLPVFLPPSLPCASLFLISHTLMDEPLSHNLSHSPFSLPLISSLMDTHFVYTNRQQINCNIQCAYDSVKALLQKSI